MSVCVLCGMLCAIVFIVINKTFQLIAENAENV